MMNPKEVVLTWDHYQSLVGLKNEKEAVDAELVKLQGTLIKQAQVIVCELPIGFNGIPLDRKFYLLTQEQWEDVANKDNFKRVDGK